MTVQIDYPERCAAMINEAGILPARVDPQPFLPEARQVLRAAVAAHASDLVDEAVRVAARDRADAVSSVHVRRASDHLVAKRFRRRDCVILTLGGALLGAAVSNALAMSLQGTYTGGGVIASISCGIIGAFMIALPMPRT